MSTRTRGPGHDAIHDTILPVEPLTEWAKTETNDHTKSGLAKAIGISRRSLSRYMTNGTLRLSQADEFTTRIGVHATEIWSWAEYEGRQQ